MSQKPIILQFVFEDFEDLPNERGWATLSDKKDDGVGHSWQLNLYPGGPAESENGNVGVFLQMNTGRDVDANVSYTLRNASGRVHHVEFVDKKRYGTGEGALGVDDFIERSEVINETNNILSGGALVIDVEIQVVDKKRKYQPTNPTLKNIRKLCESDDHSDIKFKVGKTIIPAHKLILKMNAPILAEYCGDKSGPVVIKDTTLIVFRIILYYVYGGEVPEDDVVLSMGKEIIRAADRYEIVGLKMVVETALVNQRVMKLHNVADWLVFADSINCPLLKEYAMMYFSCRVKDVMAHETWSSVKESSGLMEELLLAVSKGQSNDHFSKASALTVDELRSKLEAKGLDVDGSKETLVARLEASGSTGN